MTPKQQREWREKVRQNIENNNRNIPIENNKLKEHRLIKINPNDRRLQPWAPDDPRRAKPPIEIIDKPANPEHEKQMKYLDSILEKQKPIESKPIKPKSSFEEQLNIVFVEHKISKFNEDANNETIKERKERWNNRIFYNLADYFCSETNEDRKARYKKGIYTPEELSDGKFGFDDFYGF